MPGSPLEMIPENTTPMSMSFIAKNSRASRLGLRGQSRSGFTLLELIGVMVVIAILTAAALPSAVDLIQVQRSVNEGAELPKIAEALKRGMLREQAFPLYQNSPGVLSSGDEAYWWNLAARHGGGSVNEVRYPLGVRPGSQNTRKLYFASADWSGDTFFDIVSNAQTDWIEDPQDPVELRLLLLATTNPDLTLPNTITTNQFNKLWDDWAIGPDGNPATDKDSDGNPVTVMDRWGNYGLGSEWAGRAAELNLERIDLRDWLCTLVIENRRAIEEEPGEILEDLNSPPDEIGYTLSNLVGTKIYLRPKASDTDVYLTQRGQVVDESISPKIDFIEDSGTTSVTLTLTKRAPLALLDPNDPTDPSSLTDWDNDDPYIQNRYFLRTQELLLGEPWNESEVGIFTITEPFSTLRFDGLQWRY
ncbi:MAG: type II secretion system protein [Opitutales bacterium]